MALAIKSNKCNSLCVKVRNSKNNLDFVASTLGIQNDFISGSKRTSLKSSLKNSGSGLLIML